MTDTRMQANQVPLVERLRSVPANAHLAVNTPNPLEHDTQHFAIGAMCHQAAARLAALEAELDRAFDELGMLGVPRERARTVANGINVLMTRISKSESAMLSELEAAQASLMEANIELQRLHAGELPGGWTGELMGQIEARHKVERELEAAEKDAARYRWLRENCREVWDEHSDPVQLIHYEPHTPIHGWEERLDAAIDAARKERT